MGKRGTYSIWQKRLYEKGLEKYPLKTVIGQNLFFVVYFGLGTAGIWNLKIADIPIVSILYLFFLIIMLIFVLRKHLCTSCYYYDKRCSTDWGKLAAVMFKKNSGNYELGVKLAGVTWGLATVVPIIAMIFILIFNFDFHLLVIFILFVILTPLNFMAHRWSCVKCKLRGICPASMAKIKGNEISPTS